MKVKKVFALFVILGVSSVLLAALFLYFEGGAAHGSQSSLYQSELPDLVIDEITLSPPNPHITEPATITIKARNAGTVSVPGRRVYLYIDPVDQPPISTTQETTSWVVGIEWLPGDTMIMEYAEFTFTEPGCDHVVYAWVDPLERVDESDENNNLKSIQVCVEDEIVGGADSFEDDNTCDENLTDAIPTDGTPQVRNFFPQGDIDHVKFYATENITYTIVAAGTGAEALPVFEIGDSCDIAPTFGTTSRLEFYAPTTGWYYLKLENNQDSDDPALSTYELSVSAESTGLQPNVLAMNPTSGFADRNTNVVITGTQFVFPPLAEVCTYQDNACTSTCTQLLDTSWVNSQRLFAIVPANLSAGAYCLVVTNPGGKSDRLSNAFTVSPGTPDPMEVVPGQGYNDIPTDLHLYGFNFADGISVTIGTAALENIRVANSTHLIGTLPAGLSPGTYDLVASYTGENSATLQSAYTAIAPDEDLYAQEGDLWYSPDPARQGGTVSLGLFVHRLGGDSTLSDLPVRFSVDGTSIGDARVPSLSPDGEGSTTQVNWTPPSPGDYMVTATIDPDAVVQEASESNNTVTRTITVLEPAEDNQAPHVDTLSISGGEQSVTQTLVYLSSTATDFPDPPAGTGVADVRYIEFEYNQGARLWIPVQDSGWLSYTTAGSNYPWTITPVGGVHYVQAWAKDRADNISRFPFQAAISYYPPTETVGRDQTRIYRQYLTAGQSLHALLTPLQGDPDLYIWPPDWDQGRPPWVSNLSGTQQDNLDIVAPVDGLYQVEVYGFSSAEYQLTIQVGGASFMGGFQITDSPQHRKNQRTLQNPFDVSGKVFPTAPALPPLNVPVGGIPQVLLAGFTSNVTSGLPPLSVVFTDTSTGLIDSWLWDFGDGGTSSERHPIYTYPQPGTYTVSLSISGVVGSDIETRSDYITVLGEEPEFELYLPLIDRGAASALGEAAVKKPLVSAAFIFFVFMGGVGIRWLRRGN